MATIDQQIKKCPRRIIAAAIGVAVRRVDQLREAGVIMQTGRGVYDLVDTCERYRRY